MKSMHLVGFMLCSLFGFSQQVIGAEAQNALANYKFGAVLPGLEQGEFASQAGIVLGDFQDLGNAQGFSVTGPGGLNLRIPLDQGQLLLEQFKQNNNAEDQKELFFQVANPTNQALEIFAINMNKDGADEVEKLVMQIQIQKRQEEEEKAKEQEQQRKDQEEAEQEEKARKEAEKVRVAGLEAEKKRQEAEEADRKAKAEQQQEEKDRQVKEAAEKAQKEAANAKNKAHNIITKAVDGLRNNTATVSETYIGSSIEISISGAGLTSSTQGAICFDAKDSKNVKMFLISMDETIESLSSLSADQKTEILEALEKKQVTTLTLEDSSQQQTIVEVVGGVDLNPAAQITTPLYKQPLFWLGTTFGTFLLAIIAYGISNDVPISEVMASFAELFKSAKK